MTDSEGGADDAAASAGNTLIDYAESAIVEDDALLAARARADELGAAAVAPDRHQRRQGLRERHVTRLRVEGDGGSGTVSAREPAGV